ncbi:MAG: 1-deoxy-D-xylulose-5-phosphate reductoisomerase [Deltaproteobacteria bacterium]|nr:1-deoxy-D-xylulose-5-phosphate reductoisomerase [Deltaproteobacteria bacterium]
MKRKGLAILGSTGSIGSHTLEVVDLFPERYKVVSLSAGKNIEKIRNQMRQYRPKMVAVSEKEMKTVLAAEFPDICIEVGSRGTELCASLEEVDLVVVGIVGFAALAPTFAAVKAGKSLALANKEAMIVSGPLLKELIAKNHCRCIPVDSEHNAIFQLLSGHPRKKISSLILTASGGPLLRMPDLALNKVTPELAVRHPNWKMGAKISVDSATMMNKGLEVVEAHYLFDFPIKNIEVWVHPQSIVHGVLRFNDNSYIAQMAYPNMRSSIAHALAYPHRLENPVPPLSFDQLAKLEFFPPDEERFTALKLCREAFSGGPSYLIALNAANEVAVSSFLTRQIPFPAITECITHVLEKHRGGSVRELRDVFAVDQESRQMAIRYCRKLVKTRKPMSHALVTAQ